MNHLCLREIRSSLFGDSRQVRSKFKVPIFRKIAGRCGRRHRSKHEERCQGGSERSPLKVSHWIPPSYLPLGQTRDTMNGTTLAPTKVHASRGLCNSTEVDKSSPL